jgi:hypothetical protein
MTRITLDAPRVSGRAVAFSWAVEPATDLYTQSAFTMRFPENVDLDGLPQAFWWRIMLLCLHAHWPLLRPCEVVLPVSLPEGEREAWLRLTDAAVATLEALRGGSDIARTIDIVSAGPALPTPSARGGPHPPQLVASCFSGGRDSLAQAGLLAELGADVLLVATTSPVSWATDHETSRRREVLASVGERGPFEVIEVVSDLRGNCWNDFPGPRYGLGINELGDTFLYLAAALAAGLARDARQALIASETQVQESIKPAGMVIQHKHYMYSAATLRAVSAIFRPFGIETGSLTSALHPFQVQRLLAVRFQRLRDLQYSCWELQPGEAACSRCSKCRNVALNLLACGVSPAVAGIDFVALMDAQRDWRPPSDGPREREEHGAARRALPEATADAGRTQQLCRCLVSTPAERLERLDFGRNATDRARAIATYSRMRGLALAVPLDPEPGYRAGYLDLVDARFRDGLRAILDEHFSPAPPESYAELVANTQLLGDWITAPLRSSMPTASAAPADGALTQVLARR